jgi:hypothetical protein
MSYQEYAETGTKCSLCGRKMFAEGTYIDDVNICSEWCAREYSCRNDLEGGFDE